MHTAGLSLLSAIIHPDFSQQASEARMKSMSLHFLCTNLYSDLDTQERD